MSDGIIQVQLRRVDTSMPWGFRLRGGTDQGMPLHVENCGPKGRAGQAGMRPNDVVLSICGMACSNMTHMQVKQEILRAGNELDFVLQRGVFTGPGPVDEDGQAAAAQVPYQPQPAPVQDRPQVQQQNQSREQAHRSRLGIRQQKAQQGDEPRTQVVQEPTVKMGGPTFKRVTPKTYQVLKQELGDGQGGQAQGKPASIFDRKRQERSDYLHAKGHTIQKAFGEQ